MAIYNSNTKSLLNNNDTLYEVVMLGDQFGNPASQIGNSTSTVFGETATAEASPVFQLDGLYGIDDDNEFQKNGVAGGVQYVDENGLLSVATVDPNSSPLQSLGNAFSALRSKRSVRYRPGQGSMLRFTAMFPDGQVAGHQQVAGYINQTDILGLGYNFVPGSEFAIVRRYKSTAELFEVDITATTGGSVTVILNDIPFGPFTLPGGTAESNAAALAQETFTNWIVDYSGSKVWFLYGGPPVDLTGTFSFSGLSANTQTLQNGQLPNDNWIYQSDWNVDTLDGNGPSGMILDPASLNVYQIDFRWLGVGIIRYSIEDQISGNMIPFHIEHYTNSNDRPHISNPSMRAGYAVVNLTSDPGPQVRVKGGSMMGSIQGKIIRNVAPRSSFKVFTSNPPSDPALAQDIKHHKLTIKNDRVNVDGTLSKLNQREIIIDYLSASASTGAGGKPIIVYLYKNAELDGSVNFTYSQVIGGISESTTIGEHLANSGSLISSFAVTDGASININLTDLRMILAPLESLSVFIEGANSTIDSAVLGLTYTIE